VFGYQVSRLSKRLAGSPKNKALHSNQLQESARKSPFVPTEVQALIQGRVTASLEDLDDPFSRRPLDLA
jgi:hypothetical protein